MGADNPILMIHDVGAGGLSNAVPEVVAQSGRGGNIELRDVPSDEPGMSPLESGAVGAERCLPSRQSGSGNSSCCASVSAVLRRDRARDR
jgi:hypothetical protein